MTIKMSLCRLCIHYKADKNYTCDAFPKGIPMEFLYGEKLHFKQTEGDNGILFKVIPGKEDFLRFFQNN